MPAQHARALAFPALLPPPPSIPAFFFPRLLGGAQVPRDERLNDRG